MKILKNTPIFLLLIVIFFILPVTSFAEDTEYTITISNHSTQVSMAGNVYSAYKVFDLTVSGYDDDGKNPANYSYTVNEDFEAFSYMSGGVTYKGDSDTDTTYSLVSFFEDISDNSSELNAFAKAVKNYIEENNIAAAGQVTADSSVKAEITVSSLGYYIVIGQATANDNNSIVTAFVSLDTVSGDSQVNLKVDIPTVTKKVKECEDSTYGRWADGSIGETFSFLITATIPQYISYYDDYTYILHDSMGDGLTLERGSIKIYTDNDFTDEVGGEYYDIIFEDDENSDGDTFDIKVNSNFFTSGNEGITLYIYYQATLNTDAVIYSGSNDNSVYVEYSNDAYNEESTAKTIVSAVKVYSYSFDIFKFSGSSEGLADAYFKIYSDSECAQADEIRVVRLGTVNDAAVYRVAADGEEGVEIISPDSGLITVMGLDSGIFYIKETKAPYGYNLLKSAVEFEIKADAGEDNTYISSVKLYVEGTEGSVMGIRNKEGLLFPFTGGRGEWAIYIAGSILVIAALAILIVRRHVSYKKNNNDCTAKAGRGI